MATTSDYVSFFVPVENIYPSPDNPRYEAGDVTLLRASIKQQGLLQDLIVRPALEPEYPPHCYIIVDGFRRWTAAKYDLKEIRCRLHEPDSDGSVARQTIIVALTTTLHGQDLTPMEKAWAFGRLYNEEGMTQKQIAQRIGCSETHVSNHLALLELDEKSQKRVQDKKVSHVQALQAVQKTRAKKRKGLGHKPIDPGWEPDHFTEKHFLARKAKALCDARDHSNRRRRGGACDHCWETAIRNDEAKVQQTTYHDAGFDLPFVSPEQGLLTQGRSDNGRA
jgi:ParB family chromosome partitioning protein